jgi:hypothetical protein
VFFGFSVFRSGQRLWWFVVSGSNHQSSTSRNIYYIFIEKEWVLILNPEDVALDTMFVVHLSHRIHILSY